MRSLIIGGGAIGQYCAARLTQAGHDAIVMARPQQAQAINADGIELRVAGSVTHHRVRAAADLADASLGQAFELVIVAVKAYSTSGAIETIASIPACQGASILTVQNGLGNEEMLAGAFGADRVIAGALTVAVDRINAASIVATSKGGLSIAPLGANPHNWVIAAFAGSGMPVRAVSSWQSLKWSKLLINLLGNGVCAALDWLPEEVYADSKAFAIERLCLLEAIDTMSRLGLASVNLIAFPAALLAVAAKRMPAPIFRILLAKRVSTGRGDKLPSLLMDLRAHRPHTEIMALNGAVAERAAVAGVVAPANAAVAAAVNGIASGAIDWDEYRGQPQKLLQQIGK